MKTSKRGDVYMQLLAPSMIEVGWDSGSDGICEIGLFFPNLYFEWGYGALQLRPKYPTQQTIVMVPLSVLGHVVELLMVYKETYRSMEMFKKYWHTPVLHGKVKKEA